MEVSIMVAQIKNEIANVEKVLGPKKTKADDLRSQLDALEKDIKMLTDRYDALCMAAESLETLADGTPAVVPVVSGAEKPMLSNRHHSRQPRKIGKFNPNGKKIGEYASINKAAKAFGWNTTSMTKYIDSTSKEKQIRIRGYYLQFIAA